MREAIETVRGLAEWLQSEAPDRAPDRLRDVVREAVSRTTQQRPHGRIKWPGGGPARPRPALLAGLAAILVMAVAGLSLRFSTTPHSGGPVDTRMPSESPPGATPSAQPTPSPRPKPSGASLAPGPVTSQAFTPGLRFVAPAGWLKTEDRRATLYLNPADAGSLRLGDGGLVFDGISIYRHPVAGPPDGGPTQVPSVGTNARDLADWLSTRPQLIATKPISVTLFGRPAYRLDFRLSPSAGVLCGLPCVNLLNNGDEPMSYQYGILGTWQVRAFLVDAPDGTTVLISVDDADGNDLDAMIARARPILDSLEFVP